MATTTLRFYAHGDGYVQDLDALEAGITRMLGRKYDGGTKFISTGESFEVPNRYEYRKACKEGALRPADAETAKECGVAFEAPAKPASKADKSQTDA